MAAVNRALNPTLSPQGKVVRRAAVAAPPGLLRCLVLSVDLRRRRSLSMAAETEAWDAIVCRDAAQFLREAFQRSAPLAMIDLPPPSAAEYNDVRNAAERSKEMNPALIAVCGHAIDHTEEVWARGLGVWAYFNDAKRTEHLRFIFREARTAIERSEGPF